MPQTPLTTYHAHKLRQALASPKAAADLIAVVAAKSGTLAPTTRRHVELLVASEVVGRRICDVIDAASGTLLRKDRKALVIGLADYTIGNEVADAIDGV